MRFLSALVLTGCFVRPGLYEQQRERLAAGPSWYADCDEDGLGDPTQATLAPEEPGACAWVPNPDDCDDEHPGTGRRTGPLCADQLTVDWLRFEEADREILVLSGPSWTLIEAEDRCGDLGWGGRLASHVEPVLEQLEDGFSGWVHAEWNGATWVWGDDQPLGLPWCDAPATGASPQLAVAVRSTGACIGTSDQIDPAAILRVNGAVCERPAYPTD